MFVSSSFVCACSIVYSCASLRASACFFTCKCLFAFVYCVVVWFCVWFVCVLFVCLLVVESFFVSLSLSLSLSLLPRALNMLLFVPLFAWLS